MSLSKKVRRYRGWIALAVLLAIGGTAYGVLRSTRSDKTTTTYQTEAATKGTLAVTVAGTGNLAIYDETEVWPKTSGTVASVAVSEGETVTAGQPLFTLEPDDVDAAITKAYASYLSAKDGVTRAEVTLLRARNTLSSLRSTYAAQKSGTVSVAATGSATQSTKVTSADITAAKADVSAAKTALYSAKANRTSAKQDYEDAKDAEDELTVVAPSDGVVWSLDVAEGDTVSAGSAGSSSSSGSSGSSASGATGGTSTSTSSGSSAPLTLVDDDALSVQLTVNEVDLPSLKLGQRADITIDAFPDLTLTGKVLEIAQTGTVSSGVVTFDVWLSLDIADPQLRPGMTAAGTIVTQVVDEAVLVPNGAIESDTQGDYVMVMKAGATTPTRTDVTTGVSNDTSTQVLTGISEGDMVVTSSADSSTSDSTSSSSSDSGRGGLMMMGGGGAPSGGPGGGF